MRYFSPLGVVGAHLLEGVPQDRCVEAPDARVDLTDAAFGLARVLLLDDPLHAAIGAPDHPAVAGGVGHLGSDDRDRGTAGRVGVGQVDEGLALDEGTSPLVTSTVPTRSAGSAARPHSTARPVPFTSSWSATTSAGSTLEQYSTTRSRW